MQAGGNRSREGHIDIKNKKRKEDGITIERNTYGVMAEGPIHIRGELLSVSVRKAVRELLEEDV